MSKTKLTYKRYYGQRPRNIKAYVDADVVFTTYGMDRKNHVLHKIEWHSIVLDESHYIKNGTCRTAINSNELQGKNKWLLSGMNCIYYKYKMRNGKHLFLIYRYTI